MVAPRVPVANMETALLAHPLVWLAVSVVVFAAAWLFPPRLYVSMLGDDNYMFLDMRMLAYNSACLLLLVVGLWVGLGGQLLNARVQRAVESPLTGAPLTSYGLLLVFIFMNLTAIGLFASEGGFGAIASSLSGASLNFELRMASEESRFGAIWISLLMLPSMCFGVTYHMFRSSPRDKLLRTLFYILAVTFVVAATLSSKRNFIARPMFAALLSYLVWPTRRSIRLHHAIFVCVSAAVVILTLFLGLAVLRNGVAGTADGVREVVRYLLGGYNTEALIVNEELILPGSNKGFFWTAWIWEFPIVENLIDLEGMRSRLFGEKAPMGALERGDLLREHGLSINTAIPAFACSYVDFGWGGVLPFFAMGYLTAICWKRFVAGTLGGLIFYPMAAYAMVEMRSKIHFPSPAFGGGIILFLMMAIPLYLERPHRSVSRKVLVHIDDT